MPNRSAPQSNSNVSPFREKRRPPVRTLLLGAVGAAALAGTAGSLALLPAHAEAPVTQGMNFVGPASFADMVDRVKGAVVAVKVNVVEKAENDDPGLGGEGLPPGMPPLSPDDPLYRFFKRFGGPNGMPAAAPAQGPGARLRLHHFQRRLCRHQQPRGRKRDRRDPDAGRRQDSERRKSSAWTRRPIWRF